MSTSPRVSVVGPPIRVSTLPGLTLAISIVVAACAPAPSPSLIGSPDPSGNLAPGVDLILTRGTIVTLDAPDGPAEAEAIAIEGTRIAAVGPASEVLGLAGSKTQIVDLEGRAVYPGFIDAHSHWYQPGRLGDLTPEQVDQVLLSRGWTGTNDLNVYPEFADILFAAHEAGRIRVRMNAYLAINSAGTDQVRYGDWFDEQGLTPGATVGDRLRIPGIKIFIASDWDRVGKWSPSELTEEVTRHSEAGWQIALKQISDESLDLAIAAARATEAGDPGSDHRIRLEHALEMRPDQLDAVRELGLLPIVQLGGLEADLQHEAEMDELIADDGYGAVWPWQDMLGAGIPVIGSIAVVPAEGLRSRFTMSVAQMLHGAMTGISEAGNEPWPGREAQSLTLEQGLRALTVDAAFSTFEESDRGSLRAGKLADLVVFSEDLRGAATDPERLRRIEVAATLVDGELLWCGHGLDLWCSDFGQDVPVRLVDEAALAPIPGGVGGPGSSPGGSPGATPGPGGGTGPVLVTDPLVASLSASASRAGQGPELALDGDRDTFWSSGSDAPQWLQLDLRGPTQVSAVSLVVFQNPAGLTTHRLEVLVGGAWSTVVTFEGMTETGQVLEWRPPDPLPGVAAIRITTLESPSWPEWLEMEIEN